MSQTVAVLDIGKTNVKLALFDEGKLLWERSAPNRSGSASECPGQHEREFRAPERAAVRSFPLGHHDVRPCSPERVGPAGRILEKERLLRSGDEIRARKRTGQ